MNNEPQTIETTAAQMGYDTVLAFRSSLKGKDKKVVDIMFNLSTYLNRFMVYRLC